jgi:hypothetical protein
MFRILSYKRKKCNSHVNGYVIFDNKLDYYYYYKFPVTPPNQHPKILPHLQSSLPEHGEMQKEETTSKVSFNNGLAVSSSFSLFTKFYRSGDSHTTD